MTVNADPHTRMYHQRLKCRPNTDEALVTAFVQENHFIHCETYLCFLTAKECKARRARAIKAKKTTKLGTMPILSYEWLALAKCRTCEVNHD